MCTLLHTGSGRDLCFRANARLDCKPAPNGGILFPFLKGIYPVHIPALSLGKIGVAKCEPELARKNAIWNAIETVSGERLYPYLEKLDAKAGDVLCEPGSTIDYAYFPLGAILSMVTVLRNGAFIETANIGAEGSFAICFALYGLASPIRAASSNLRARSCASTSPCWRRSSPRARSCAMSRLATKPCLWPGCNNRLRAKQCTVCKNESPAGFSTCTIGLAGTRFPSPRTPCLNSMLCPASR